MRINHTSRLSGINGLNILYYIVWLAVLTILQPTVIQWISIFAISPDMFLIFVICTASLKGRQSGAVCGFFFGLVFDMMTGRMLGLSAILYMYTGLATGVLKESIIQSESHFSSMLYTLAAAFVCQAVYLFAYSAAYGNPGLVNGMLKTVIPKAIYTAAAMFTLGRFIKHSFNLIFEKSLF